MGAMQQMASTLDVAEQRMTCVDCILTKGIQKECPEGVTRDSACKFVALYDERKVISLPD